MRSRLSDEVRASGVARRLLFERTEADDFYDRDREKEINRIREFDLQSLTAKQFVKSIPSAVVNKLCKVTFTADKEKPFEVPFFIIPLYSVADEDRVEYIKFLREISANFPNLIHNENVLEIIEMFETTNRELLYTQDAFVNFKILDTDGDISKLIDLSEWLYETGYIKFATVYTIYRGETLIYLVKEEIILEVFIATTNVLNYVSTDSAIVAIGMIRFY